MGYRIGSASFLIVACVLCACGDDSVSAGKDAGVDAGGGGGGQGGTNHKSDSGPEPEKDAGTDGGGVPRGEEGAVCGGNADCQGDLRCVIAEVDAVSVGICARSCASFDDCENDELCYAYTQNPSDAHCVDLKTETYSLCGVGDTSRCDGHTCLYLPSSTLGLCVDLCALPGSSSGADAGADDAGVDPADACGTGQICIAGVLDSVTQGLCGVEVGRGDSCAPEKGRFCAGGDGCVPDAADEPFGARHCREDCSDDGKCQKGTSCQGIVGQTAYCF